MQEPELIFYCEIVVTLLLLMLMWIGFAAYCTGLLLARRVLKKLDMDQEYEGNVEVAKGSFFLV